MERHALEVYIEKLHGERLLVYHNCSLDDAVRPVNHLSYDSNKTVQGTLFVCKGAGFKRDYLEAAAQKGAFAYISETDYDAAIPCIKVSDVKKALALAAAVFYGDPAEKLTLVGITGTKGKSTTAYYIKYILDEYLKAQGMPEAGIISSIDTYDGVIRQESHLTTPESLELQMHFRNAADSGIRYMVMEASSQALKYGRLHGVRFDAGIFLNISEDHISPIEHSDMEDYFSSKLKMFSHCRTACINTDSDRLPRIMEAAKSADNILTFGTREGADIYGYDIRKDGFDTLFHARCDRFDREFRLTMPGLFNVENALAAIAASYTLRIPEQYIYSGLRKARSSGRMEYFANETRDRIVIVDYAHNKLSFTKLYETVKSEFPGMKIVTVFGCPGGKAYIRRRDLGLLAGIHSDKVYLTAEDPGPEDTRKISEDIAQYVRRNNTSCELIDDREQAIKEAILSSEPGTVILITGKGRETRQKYGKEYIPVPSDVELTQKYLAQFGTGHGI
jgi:UDP-N-acetylmuramyl-tripeptide synthetase